MEQQLTKDALNLAGQVVIISGACGELGIAITTALLEAGASILANDIVTDIEASSRLPNSERLGYFRSSTSTRDEGRELVEACHARFGKLPDTVLCHAGIVESHPIEDYPTDIFDIVMTTNVRSNFLLAQAASTAWRDAQVGGHLIFTSSWVADNSWPGIAPYGASKAAINSMMRSFARELAPYGIRANSVSPGIVAAGMAKRQWDNEPEYRRRAQKAIPLGTLQDVDSVSNAFLFMCSSLASYMTGSVLLVDGGSSLYPMD
jgi:NAD(P)-dependent dehydrogenase (short-subunit alcohol dehydrogenase family)